MENTPGKATSAGVSGSEAIRTVRQPAMRADEGRLGHVVHAELVQGDDELGEARAVVGLQPAVDCS